MLDLLSPLRGYIAQNLQFYLSKYIEDIQLEGLGLFGGDLVLNDLEIKRHVLRESLEIPSSFDFSRGFIRELRIHIPWTQLLSQPIEVKLYTIELILTGKNRSARAASVDTAVDREPEIEQPKSGWINDTLQRILANISVQVNNLVLKYENDDVVFSIALGTLDFYSANEKESWKRSFEELKGGRRAICKRIDAKDVTIFLDRYTNDGVTKDGGRQDSVRRKVIGYEVPVLSRTSASVRAKLQLFPNAAMNGQGDSRSNLASPASPLHQQRSTASGVRDEGSIIDMDGLFAYKPSVLCDPFYYYSCNRSRVTPMYEVDIFIGELFFSVSDRQLEMLNQLIQSASRKIDQAHELSSQTRNRDYVQNGGVKADPTAVPTIPAVVSQKDILKVDTASKKQESWFGWAMNALGAAEDGEEDELVSELLAETRGALLKGQPPVSDTDQDTLAPCDLVTKTSCVRVCVSSASLTLRKHEKEVEVELQDSIVVEDGEEFVPVANLGMVKVSLQTKKKKVARPAVPILHLTLSYVALEMLVARGQERNGTDVVFEVEKVELVSATPSENREDLKCKKGEVLLTWGSIDSSHFSNCVSHPYFINSFFGEETTRLSQRESRSFEIVKVSLDTGIPIWKTSDADRDSDGISDSPCECFTTWNGENIRCVPISTISQICKQATRMIGIKERVLNEGILSNAVSTAWASSGFPISISDGVARSLSSAAHDYRVHRNPDLGALDNLMQLLQPQLVALFARYMLHSCSAASLHPSSGSPNIRHRSVHSALRLRSALMSNFIERDVSSPDAHAKEETVSKALDISIGAAQAVLEPPKCVEILEALSIFMRKKKDGEDKVVGCGETPTLSNDNVVSNIQTIVQSDVKLITASEVHVLVPGMHADSGQDSVRVCSRGGLHLAGNDFTWQGSFHPGSSKNHLQLGALTAHLEKTNNDVAIFPLIEALGFELLTTESSADAGDNDGLFVSLIKLKIDLSLTAAQEATTVVNRVVGPLGYPIAWEPMHLASKRLHNSFQIEVGRAGFSRIVSNQPRLVMAQRQSLSGEIASVSVALKAAEGKNPILQGGVAPMAIRGSESISPFFTFGISQEKASGRMNVVPLLNSLGLFTLNPGLLTSSSTQCQLSVQAQLAHVLLDMQGLTQLIGAVLCLVREILANLPARKESITTLECSEKDAKEGDAANSVLTGWSCTIDLKAAGGDVRVNEALQLKLPLLSLSSVEQDTGSTQPVKPGGELKLVFSTKGATLRASDCGTLAGLEDPTIFSIDDAGISVDFSHRYVDCRHSYGIDATVQVSSIKASLSRLKLVYLLKLPFIESEVESRKSPAIVVSHSQEPGKREDDTKAASRCRWYWRLGAQLDRAEFSCMADIYHRSTRRRRQIRTVVDGKVLNIGVATRIGNYHPTQNQQQQAPRHQFTDIQASIGDIQVVEKLQNARRGVRTRFGEFSRLPEHAFMGILVCLDLPELKCISETFHVSSASIIDLESLPSAMLSWHLASSIAKTFLEGKTEWRQREADRKQSFAEIPLIITRDDRASAKTANAFPLLSGFYRNYSEAGLPHHVIAGSVENVDIAVTTSSLYCLASALDMRGRGFTDPSPVSNETTDTGKPVDPRSKATPRVSLAHVEVSVLFGQVRLILPNESMVDSMLSKRSVVPGNVVVVLESMSLASAIRNDISLDGLGYPPFNSRILPRRPTLQAQRFGQSQLRIGCRAGKISGFVAELDLHAGELALNGVLDVVGPFEEYIGYAVGCSARFVNANTFWSPLNVTCSIEEEPLAKTEANDAGVKTTASIAFTKLRLDLHKPSFDVLVSRVVGITRGINSLLRSIGAPPQVKLTPIQLSRSSEVYPGPPCTHQREVAFSCDGIEINVFTVGSSTHIRVGSIIVAHNSSTLSGSASIQNLVVGHRTNENPTSKTVAIEGVVFGANADPSLWQLAVENYPEKLIAARWSFGDRSEGTLFLNVQAYQLHVSHHLIQALTEFSCIEPDLSISDPWREKAYKSGGQPMDRKLFVLQQRWNIKVLVAPSVMSYWRQNTTNKGKSGIWMKSGQLFASVAVGTDEMAQQSLRAYGLAVNDINRFVAVPTLKMMLNMDKFGLNTSNNLPPLEVHFFLRDSVGPGPSHTSSTWQQFSKYINGVSEAQRLLHDCSVRVTGDQHNMLERVVIGEAGVCLLYTEMARTNIQAEVNELCVKLSSPSLAAVQSLLYVGSGKRLDRSTEDLSDERYTREVVMHKSSTADNVDGFFSDDFKNLRRMAEGRRPLPGELVFTESLLIETQSVVSGSALPVVDTKVQVHIDPNIFDIVLSDVAAFLVDCNKPWDMEDHESSGERSSHAGLSNKTHSWMGMRWCYHIPRKVCKIVANPVPIPPNGVPSGWPSWNWNEDQEDGASRHCDILCQLRCWDSKKSCYVVVCEFFVPWEDTAASAGSGERKDTNEPGSFGELMSQWFDDDMEETRYRSKMLEFGARTRAYTFDNELPSDNWELRWRAPLQSEQEPENNQKRLVVNALLASSLQVHSVLTCDAYQRVVSSVTLPQVTLSISHAGPENECHDIITTELNDTEISCAVSGGAPARKLNVRVSSVLQMYLDNMAQLLTVSVIPRTTVDAMVEISSKGLEVSTLIGPVSLYLNQTAMLVIFAIPKLLQEDSKQSQAITANPDERMSSMRIRVVNHTGVDIWYRQEGTSECLVLPVDASAAYSWLSLASNPFYQLRFALDDPRKKRSDNKLTDSVQSEQEDPRWCDPCRIKENGVTGRYFDGHGFVWICVELSGLLTIVTLRSSLTARNYCDFAVRVKVNKDGPEYSCTRSDELYRNAPAIRRSVNHHLNCVSLDGSACTLSSSARNAGSVSCIMAESMTTVSFGIEGGSWCDLETLEGIPSEFDLVKISDNEAESSKRTHCKFTTLHPKSPDEQTHYVWVKIARVQCKTVLPTDFDPLRPHLSGRYTWMEMSLWPAITVENILDIPVTLSLSQKLTTVNLEVSAASEKSLSTINPFEPVDAQLQYGQGVSSSKPLKFLLQCRSAGDSKGQIFVFEGCKVVVSFCSDHRPMIRIRTERILSVANMTPSDLNISIGSPLGNQGALERIDSCVERSIGFAVASNRLVIAIATIEDSSSSSDHIEWSPGVSLNVNGDTKPIIVPPAQAGLRSLASAYCIELVNSDGYLKLIIRPQVVVINSTNCDLKCVPTDGRGNSLVEEENVSVVSGSNAGWSVPVCLHKEAKKRSIRADVSSWLSSKLSRRPSEDPSNAAKQALVARLSCSFRVTLVEDGYEWTDEIAVLLPKIPLLLTSDGKLRIVEPETSSSAPTNTQEGLYSAPSTTTYRRRLLIRHHGFRHKMLTYTMTQKEKSIHIMFFVDHQPPVIIHNQWQSTLGFRNVSFPSDPEGVGADFYLEYDWGLQVSAKHRTATTEENDTNNMEVDPESKLLSDWLEAPSQSLANADIPDTTASERMRFQIGSPQYGWSNSLWQVGGIQFASFSTENGSASAKPGPTFLVMCFYRAGSWLISVTCLEDPTHDGQVNPTPSLVLPSVASPVKAEQTVPAFLKVGVVVEELSLHFCDEHDPLRDARGMILYPEILRATCNAVSIVFATAPDPPEVSRHSTRLGYLSHIRSYTTLFVAVEDIEVGHFLQTCNFPVILHFAEAHASKNLLQFDRVKKHERLGSLMDKLLDKQLPGANNACLVTRVIYTDTWDPIDIPTYFHSIELKLAPAVLQVEDDILTYVNAFVRPLIAAVEGELAVGAMHDDDCRNIAPSADVWSLHAYESAVVTTQRRVYIEWLEISNLQVTITARVSIPVLNSFDSTPLHFASTEMREVFSFPDQLIKDLAADYVADTIVRSPMLLMSLNILGNPAGFLRSFGQGIRDLVEIPLAASRNGYSPWVLTKGVVSGVASFLGHTTAATLTSVSGFSYSISRTMDQLTLPPDQLRKRHYTRPTHLSSALADGLGSLGSSVVGAAAGVITTPIAVYKERQMQGLDTGIRNVVGGVGMGLVGIVARPMGGVASLVSMTSDGLLYGMGGSRTPFDDSASRFDARPNELLRYKLKVLPDAIGSNLIFAHGIWVIPDGNTLLVPEQELDYISEEQLETLEPLRDLLLPRDTTHRLVQVTVVCSNECVYVVGMSGAQNQVVLARTPLKSIEAVEESLKEPTVFDLGIKTPASAEWLRFRLPQRQRRQLSHQLRLWLTEDSVL
ncbi:hypothetical protein F441_03121 [Phytophthora nicotianae CJ01A1]|uniref:Chorein N-terminal domain-containing protein n=1 Tax=Phytophthora nicotianae CJ01A1 TaxID=1317063 RepID=W2XLQ5_PHYNI|nr:hypothetical protein F441_03121 [Phytophthora nicotianae CJ01A1]